MINAPSAYNGMVTSPHHLASQAGRDVLKDGGNAVEAAVATAAALAVVYPHMNSIGGDSFWLIRKPDGEMVAIDACGALSTRASLQDYRGLAAVPWRGALAANTVAGTISGWQAALSCVDARLPLDRLLEPAIFYASDGVAVTDGWARLAEVKDEELRSVPGYADTYRPQGRPLRAGERFVNPALGQTLKTVARKGLDDFYRGDLAQNIAADLKAFGCPLHPEDLARQQAVIAKPLLAPLSDGTVFNTPPPTQGLASLLILAILDRLNVSLDADAAFIHAHVEATKQAFMVRDAHVGDPRYMTLDPQAFLEDQAALDGLVAQVDPRKALPWPQEPATGDTVWFAAMDAQGWAVSAIQSTYFEFGSGIVLPGSGITWQNRGSSFRLKESGWNALKPARKPFHTLNPAMAAFNDGRVMAYGTMGGEGQPQTQAAVYSRYRLGVPLQQAVTMPRWLLGRTWGEQSVSLKIEDRYPPSVYRDLRDLGHEVEVLEPFTSVMGHAGALVRHPDGRLEGATDPRSDGGVAAW